MWNKTWDKTWGRNSCYWSRPTMANDNKLLRKEEKPQNSKRTPTYTWAHPSLLCKIQVLHATQPQNLSSPPYNRTLCTPRRIQTQEPKPQNLSLPQRTTEPCVRRGASRPKNPNPQSPSSPQRTRTLCTPRRIQNPPGVSHSEVDPETAGCDSIPLLGLEFLRERSGLGRSG